MNAALEFELLKARRAGVFRWGAVVVAVGVPGLSTGFFELVRLGGDSPSAAKAATMITDLSLAGLLGTAGQVLSVAILMSAGIAASWSFGREFVDDALPVLFAIATPRTSRHVEPLAKWPGGGNAMEDAVDSRSASKRAQRSLHRGLGFLHLLLVSRKIA